MKACIWIPLLCVAIHPIENYGQNYLRGEVKDELGRRLSGVKIQLSKSSYLYNSGSAGSFGIPTKYATDTITLSLDGYEVLKKLVDTRKFQSLVLKMLPATARLYKRKLSSVTNNLKQQQTSFFSVMGESYSNLIENNFIETGKYPETGFALNIDKASYSNIRRFLSNEMLVPTDAVRIEEMLNYFNFFDTPPAGNAGHVTDFSCETALTSCPWNHAHQLLFLDITAPKLALDSIPPSNLVFLIDISGSMDKPNRLPLLQSAFKLLVNNLREKDTISIMTYGGGVGIALPPVSGADKQRIINAIDSLSAGGDTPGAGAISNAYELARSRFLPKGNNRVILATDGDFNVGQTSEKDLEDLIVSYRQTGIYLTCLGVGMGNYKDSKLETLSKKGNGNFAYIDNVQEAEKVLVTEFTQTMYAVANDAFLDINFNSSIIKEYRLIGFDNRKYAIGDSTSELEGGEIGSGHAVMALFEIIPRPNEPVLLHEKMADIKLQYKQPRTNQAVKQQFTVPYSPKVIDSVDAGYRMAAAIALFGSLLKQSAFCREATFEDVLALAKTSVNSNDQHQKEFLTLVEKAIKIYTPGKRKKKDDR